MTIFFMLLRSSKEMGKSFTFWVSFQQCSKGALRHLIIAQIVWYCSVAGVKIELAVVKGEDQNGYCTVVFPRLST